LAPSGAATGLLSDMAHKGRTYPYWNPTRRLTLNNFPGDYTSPGTEYQWQVQNWRGVIAFGAPLAGRGMLFYDYDPTTDIVTWRLPLSGSLGPPFVCFLKFRFDQASQTNYWGWETWVGGVNQSAVPDQVASGGYQSSTAMIESGGSWFPPGSTAAPNGFIYFQPRPWSSGPPFPPLSQPF